MHEDTAFRLARPTAPLPTESEFGESLDARSAWRDFGNLSIQQAYELFLTNPLGYQEDFMFMGSRAFEYYLPVIDRYLREISSEDELDDCEAAVIGSGVALQFDWNDSDLSRRAVAEIEELSTFVLGNLSRYSPSPVEQRRIEIEWNGVHKKAEEYRMKGEPSVRGDGKPAPQP